MADANLILLSNFYGSYLEKSHFMSDVIVNNAGIEQLASLGVDKLKQVKSRLHPKDEIHVLVVAGLTDVLIKSVEQNKNKLEITPNSTQLLETKMEWAHKLLADEGAIVFWAVMPPISLRMYHQSEGWNVQRIPGMSAGLDKEQLQLNQLMLSYRNLCIKLNKRGASKVFLGPFFTDMVAEVTSDKRSISLNISFFEDDGISPNSTLVSNWNNQVDRLKSAISRYQKPYKTREDPWDLPPARKPRADNSRSYGDIASVRDSRRSDERKSLHRDRERDSHDDRYGDATERKRLKVQTPPSSIPSLMDFRPPATFSNPNSSAPSFTSGVQSGTSDQQLSTAMQLLAAASLQLGGNNVPSGNMQAMLDMILSQQRKEEEAKRKQEEERQAELTRRLEEEKLMAVQRRLEEEKRREELRRVEEERRRRIEEENRLREIQLAAQRALEKQQLEQQERLHALQSQLRQAQYVAEQKAQRELLEAARRAQTSSSSVTPLMAVQAKPSALDRINEKLQQDRRRKDPPAAPKDVKPDPKIVRDPAWQTPVVLFSFVNRNGYCRPLRGISGSKLPIGRLAESDCRSRGQWVYQTSKTPNPSVSFMKLKVKRPGEMSDFETKVAAYNNKLFDLILESERLIGEGRKFGYTITLDEPHEKIKRSSPSGPFEKQRTPSPKFNDKVVAKQDRNREAGLKTDKANCSSSSRPLALSKYGKASSSRGDAVKKETSLPPSEPKKPRWDKSDESEEELLWEDDIDHSKTNEEEDGRSIASFKEDPAPAAATIEQEDQGGEKDSKYAKEEDDEEAINKKSSQEQEASEVKADNLKETEEKGKQEGFVTLDDMENDAKGDGKNSAATNETEADEDPDAVDDFVTIDEAN